MSACSSTSFSSSFVSFFVVLSALKRRHVQCQPATASPCAQCSLPDLSRDHLRFVFPAGPRDALERFDQKTRKPDLGSNLCPIRPNPRLEQHAPSAPALAVRSSGMILASGARGPGFLSQTSPLIWSALIPESLILINLCPNHPAPGWAMCQPSPHHFWPEQNANIQHSTPVGLADRRLSRSAKVSSALRSVLPAGMPDLSRDHLRSVCPARPQPRPSARSVPRRASAATICAQCSVPDLNREKEFQKECQQKNARRYARKNVRRNVRKNVKRYITKIFRQNVRKNAGKNVKQYARKNVRQNVRRFAERMPERMSDKTLEDMPERMSQDMADRMSGDMPERMSERVSEEMFRQNVRRYVRKNARQNVRRYARKNVRNNVRRYFRKNVRKNVKRYVRKNVRRVPPVSVWSWE